MATTTTKSIILSIRDSKEKDKRVVYYTRDFGLRDAVAIGTKKIASKQRGRLELGVITALTVAKGKRSDKITTSFPFFYPKQIRNSLVRLLHLQFLLQLLKETSKPDDPNSQLFDMLCKAIVALENVDEWKLPKWKRAVVQQYLAYSGFEPVESKSLEFQTQFYFEKRVKAFEILAVI